MKRSIRVATATLALSLGTAGLAACSSGSSGTSSTTTAGASASAPAARSAAPGLRNGFFTSAKVQACLKAAGVAVPTGGNFPRRSGAFPSGSRPSGSMPSGSMPSGARPSGAGGGFGGNSAQSKKIQAALKACGISFPTGGNPGPGAAPSASSS